MGDIKPIETIYNGYRFRSRLEARWAVFFDSLGVKYEYEPEGFTKDGEYYLPDFRVMCCGYRGERETEPSPLYIEVKGVMDADSARKIKTFSFYHAYDNTAWPNPEDPERDEKMKKIYAQAEAACIPLLIVGNIPDVQIPDDVTDSNIMHSYESMGFSLCPFNYETVDGDYFAAYPAADSKGHFYLMGDDRNYVNAEDEPRILKAYQAARQSRFEHGETPKVVRPND